ncbi:MAG: N-acetylmuramoyl-L-alanine amidase family protein [Candidatus Dormibacteria bacterium]
MRPRANLLLRVLVGATVMSSASALPAAAAASSPPSLPLPFVVAIDPGHGGIPNDANPSQLFDPGAISGTGTLEKDLTLKIALELRDLLVSDEVKVVMTRSDDRFVEISQRMRTANQAGARLFISIHLNSFTDRATHGSVVLYPVDADRPFAQALSVALHNRLQKYGFADGGILPKPDLWVHAEMPTATIEAGYLSNPHDAEALDQPAVQDAIARAARDGIEMQAPEIGQLKARMAAFRAAHAVGLASPGLTLPRMPDPRLLLAWMAAMVSVASAIRWRRQVALGAAVLGGVYASFLSPGRRPTRRRRSGSVRPRHRAVPMPTISARGARPRLKRP